jgi:cobalamin biosynthetic protein CobC
LGAGTTRRLALEGRASMLWRRALAGAGGTHLFRLYDTPDAQAAQNHLADHRIWSRIFPWSPRLIRLGLPGMEAEWLRLAAALG